MNATTPAPARQRRQRAKPARSIRLVVPPAGGTGVVRVRVGRQSADYSLREFRSDVGGRAFELAKLGLEGDGECYHVRLTGNGQDSCDCRGFVRHSHCKHRDGLAALVAAGRLYQGSDGPGGIALPRPSQRERVGPMLLRHATLARNLNSILRHGLLCSYSKGKLAAVWLCTPAPGTPE